MEERRITNPVIKVRILAGMGFEMGRWPECKAPACKAGASLTHEGSSPSLPMVWFVPIAQLEEHRTSNPGAGGSNPPGDVTRLIAVIMCQ